MHGWRIAGAVAAKIFRMLACLVAAYLIYAMAFLIPGSDSVVERVEHTAVVWLLLAACSVGLSYLFRMKDGVKRSFWKTEPFVFFALFTGCLVFGFLATWVR
jgi:heme/copper-type cytochrome/quinol oxidase subunit 4